MRISRRSFLKVSAAALGSVAVRDLNGIVNAVAAQQDRSPVFFTKDLSVNGLLKIYSRINQGMTGKIGIKLHTLVIFDSFWSEETARIFEDEIAKTLHRHDFSYVINMVDRLDMFGGNAAYQDATIIGHENILTKYGNEETVKAERNRLIEMWRDKEELSRNRLKQMDKGSENREQEQEWMNKCKILPLSKQCRCIKVMVIIGSVPNMNCIPGCSTCNTKKSRLRDHQRGRICILAGFPG